jgi:hypothetical protein
MSDPAATAAPCFRSTIRHAGLATLYDLWKAKRGDRLMPARTDLDVLELWPWLGNLVLIEFFSSVYDYKIRVDGTNIAEVGGDARTGKGIESLTNQAERDLLMQQYGRVLAERRPFFYETEFLNSAERHLRESKLLLPLSADGARVNMVLAGIYYRVLKR